MGLDSPAILIFAILFFAVTFFILRWIFSIKKFLAFQKAQTALLIEIAKKQGADSQRVGEIIGELNNS